MVLALVFGGSAAVGIVKFRAPQPAPAPETVPVVVAAADVPRGGTITADLIKTRDYPKDLVPPGADQARGRGRPGGVSPLVKDEPVLDAKLSAEGAGRGMAALIPKGMRAVTIQTPNVASGVAGFVLPGNKVDVLLTVTAPGSQRRTGGGGTTTLLQKWRSWPSTSAVDAPAETRSTSRSCAR